MPCTQEQLVRHIETTLAALEDPAENLAMYSLNAFVELAENSQATNRLTATDTAALTIAASEICGEL